MADRPLKLYSELATWWPLLSPPSHYVEEAADLRPALHAAPDAPPRTLLELGSGGGSLAFHLKGDFQLTLTDRVGRDARQSTARSTPSASTSRATCARSTSGARSIIVLIHDAIMYCTDPASVQRGAGDRGAALPSRRRDAAPPGLREGDLHAQTPITAAKMAPDGRALRYLEWTTDPDPADDTFQTLYVFAMREADGTTAVEHDLHLEACSIAPRGSSGCRRPASRRAPASTPGSATCSSRAVAMVFACEPWSRVGVGPRPRRSRRHPRDRRRVVPAPVDARDVRGRVATIPRSPASSRASPATAHRRVLRDLVPARRTAHQQPGDPAGAPPADGWLDRSARHVLEPRAERRGACAPRWKSGAPTTRRAGCTRGWGSAWQASGTTTTPIPVEDALILWRDPAETPARWTKRLKAGRRL